MPRVSIDESLKPLKVPIENGFVKTYVKHQFISMIHNAYIYHQVPTITPDDVWLTILNYLAKNVNENEDHYRKAFGLDEGKKEIVVKRTHIDFEDTACIESMFHELISMMDVQNSKIADFECDFSTSTTITRLCSQVSLAHMMENFFSFKMVLSCGFPALKFEGTEADWRKIITKLEAFKKIGHTSIQKYLDACSSVIAKILTVYTHKGSVKWKEFYYSEICGSGGQSGYRGFVLDLLNVRIDEAWEPNELSSMRSEYKFVFEIEATGQKTDMCIESGPCQVDDSFKLKYDFKIKKYVSQYTIDGENLEFKEIDWKEIEKISFKNKKIIDIIFNEKPDSFRAEKYKGNLRIKYPEKLKTEEFERMKTHVPDACEYKIRETCFTISELNFDRMGFYFPSDYVDKAWETVFDSIPEGLEEQIASSQKEYRKAMGWGK